MAVTNATQLLLDNVANYNMNPSSIMSSQLKILQMVLDGQEIVDPTSPFVFNLEASATLTAGAIMKTESATRKLYSRLALTPEDVYHHMSDKDYIGIYATPANCTLNVLIPYYLLINNGIPDTNNPNIKYVVIPRDSVISVNGMPVSFGYPIVFTILSDTNIQVTYDTTIVNPLLKIFKNALPSNIINYNNSKYLQVPIPAIQVGVKSSIFTLSPLNSFVQSISFTDKYCYTRVYLNTGNTGWVEIKTTMTPLVYDITDPTALLRVNSNYVVVTLPDIYTDNSNAASNIRIDVYTTQGNIDTDLSQLAISSYSANWLDYDTLYPNKYVSPLKNINDILFYSTEMMIGGSDGLTFEQIRQRAVYHISPSDIPIRFTDISINLATLGYNVQKLLDGVTDRVYVASKSLPNRDVNGLVTSPLSCNSIVNISTKYGFLGSGYSESVITHATQRTTILPTALYIVNNGNVSLVADSVTDYINSLTGNDTCNALNAAQYMYSPFYYLIDFNAPTPLARPYYLSPSIVNVNYIESNKGKNFNIVITNISIALKDNEYVLTVDVSNPTGLTGVAAQLRYVDVESKDIFYLDGVAPVNNTAKNLIRFTFTLRTSFDIDPLNNLELLGFNNNYNTVGSMYVSLDSIFDLFFMVQSNGPANTPASSFDNKFNKPGYVGVSYETVLIQFGKNLTNLYCPVNTILSSTSYLTYENDVYQTYTEDVYDNENDLGTPFITDGDGITFVIKHHKGDNVLDAIGRRVVLHHAGDYQTDIHGNYIVDPKTNNGILQQIGITLLDAKYRYATSSETMKYRDNIPDVIVEYLESDIITMSNQLDARTELYYTPVGEPNMLVVSVGNNTILTVPANLNVSIIFYASEHVLKDDTSKNNIKKLTRTLITKYLNLNTISVNEFTKELRNILSNQVAGFKIVEFLPNDSSVVTLIDTTKSFSVSESLVLLSDNTLEVVDNIVLKFELEP